MAFPLRNKKTYPWKLDKKFDWLYVACTINAIRLKPTNESCSMIANVGNLIF